MAMYDNNSYEARERERQEEYARRDAMRKRIRNRIIGASIGGVIFVGGLLGVAVCHETIKPGFVGIVYNMSGGIENTTLTQGWKWVAPWKHVNQYSVATEQANLSKDPKEGSKNDDSFNIPTSDGKTVNVDLEFSYHFDGTKLPATFTMFKGQDGKTIEETFVRSKMKAWAGEVSSTFSVLDVYGSKRADLNAQTLKHAQDKFAPYGIVIDAVNFTRVGLDDATAKAIQAKIDAEQQLQKVQIEANQAKIEADKARTVAQGQADAALINAQGQAKANEVLSNSITPVLLQKMEMDARIAHGWITVEGGTPIVTTK